MWGLIRSPILRSPTAQIMRIRWRMRGEDCRGNSRIALYSTGQGHGLRPRGPSGPEGEMRDKILYIAILILVAIAFFEGGFIVGHLKTDGLKEKLQQVNEWVIDHGGRIVALETVQKKAEGKKQ